MAGLTGLPTHGPDHGPDWPLGNTAIAYPLFIPTSDLMRPLRYALSL